MTGEDTLPYNSNNTLITVQELYGILNKYGVHTKVKDLTIFQKCFVHRSYCTRKNQNFINGNTNCPPGCIPLQEDSNECLEYLGDAVLNLIIASYLYERYKDENEGFLTKMRTKLVNGVKLAEFSKILGFPKYPLISKQIEDSGGRNQKNILEDCFESFLGALYIDLGFETCKTWLVNFVEQNVDFPELILQNTNYKDTLMKHYQYTFNETPKFFEMDNEIIHNVKVYTVCIKDSNEKIISIAKGKSKKEAENQAAKQVLDKSQTYS